MTGPGEEGGEAARFVPRDKPSPGRRRQIILIDSDTVAARPFRPRRGAVVVAVLIVAALAWVGVELSADDEGLTLQSLAPPSRSVAPASTPTLTPTPTPTPAPPPPARTQAQTRPRPASVPRTPRAPAVSSIGFLSVSARPWAVLSVDGRVIGNTPQIRVRLPAGVHTVRLARDGFEPYEAAVALKAGETVRVTNIALAALTP